MNFLKRAMVSIKRRPGKTVILLLLVFILGNIISGAISVGQAVQNTEHNLRRNLPAVATIEQDYEAMERHSNTTGEWPQPERITPETIQQIGELSYVRSFDYSVSSSWDSFFSSELERVSSSDNEEIEVWDNGIIYGVDNLVRFTLKGVHNPEILDVQEGIIDLVQGRTFTEQEMGDRNSPSYVAVISRSFAELNNLTVSSTFTLDNTVYDQFNLDDWVESEVYAEDNVFARETHEFEVIGIFEPVAEPNTGDDWMDSEESLQLENRIYVPNGVTEASDVFLFEHWLELGVDYYGDSEDVDDWIWYNPTYLLNDPTELQAFSEAATLLLPEFVKVNDLSNTFADIATSMETLQWISSLVLWIAVGATLLILSLLITLFLRDRKYEIGIYLALGEKKLKIISQIILEVVVTGVVAITLALFTGSLLAGNISETMLRQDLINQQENTDWRNSYSYGSSLNWFSDGDLSMEEMLESYDLSLEVTTTVLFYGVGISALLVSTFVPIMYVTRLNPKKIMM